MEGVKIIVFPETCLNKMEVPIKEDDVLIGDIREWVAHVKVYTVINVTMKEDRGVFNMTLVIGRDGKIIAR